MDISRERAADPEGGTTIRLRYSRQFQSGGHAHTIDAETTLPVGASQERREQVLRELEMGVEQLARQISQRGARPTSETRSQAPTRPGSPTLPAGRASEAPRSQGEPLPQRQTGSVPTPAASTPVSESMPVAPAASGERTVRLADFINVIKRYWNMSPQEAMKLLNVKNLDGLNYREAFNELKAMMDKHAHTSRSAAPTSAPRPTPAAEAPRQSNPGGTTAPAPRTPVNAATTTAQGQAAVSLPAQQPAPPTRPVTAPRQEARVEQEREKPREPEAGVDFAGSPRAPIPIQRGVVRDISSRPSYQFEEEDDAESYELPGSEDSERLTAQIKLDELKEIRGSSAASAERLTVLNNVIGSQISEHQLQKILQAAWGMTNKKKLKNAQVEALISWAKEDYFVEEAEAVLRLIEGEEQ